MTNSVEMMMIASSAAPFPKWVSQNGVPPMMAAVAKPASSGAQHTSKRGNQSTRAPNPMGRPAYQKAGINRIQKDMLQAAATPAGPHGSARTKTRRVAAELEQGPAKPAPRLPDGEMDPANSAIEQHDSDSRSEQLEDPAGFRPLGSKHQAHHIFADQSKIGAHRHANERNDSQRIGEVSPEASRVLIQPAQRCEGHIVERRQ